MQIIYNSDRQPLCIQISNIVQIVYEYTDRKISKIHRLNNNGQILYTHSYLHKGIESMIEHPGFIERTVDYSTYTCSTSYGLEICRYNEIGNIVEKIIDGATTSYQYDEQNRLLHKTRTFEDKLKTCDALLCIYNDFGNLEKNIRYIYDKDNRLTEVISEDTIVSFTPDRKVFTRRMLTFNVIDFFWIFLYFFINLFFLVRHVSFSLTKDHPLYEK